MPPPPPAAETVAKPATACCPRPADLSVARARDVRERPATIAAPVVPRPNTIVRHMTPITQSGEQPLDLRAVAADNSFTCGRSSRGDCTCDSSTCGRSSRDGDDGGGGGDADAPCEP